LYIDKVPVQKSNKSTCLIVAIRNIELICDTKVLTYNWIHIYIHNMYVAML